ncbi:two-component system sensor histidine kinase NtrB [Desulfallas thermosapovorans]|uniref:histidine kinase n=1 Tax=Desulfallas thermosapovorans DSM 6562 TaxID=1121431 RepID=A0A5S4ZWL6_9FIRM|nr:ATP-binding protein [Desulfallas thermosapovorans]TYO97418.1 two-component system sensor histidine kinase AtoS [Desulfallas thermosapovorans DSM 6562]
MVALAEGWLDLAVNHLPAGILMINREGRICVMNQVLSRMTGLKNDVLGRSLHTVSKHQGHGINKLLQTIHTGIEFQGLNPETVLPVTGPFECTVNTYLVKEKNGATAGAMAVFIPVGRQQELENAVIKAEKLAILGQMAAGMVHEIRNPLTIISGFMQLLQNHLKGTSKEKYISLSLAELNRVNNLLTEFLQLSKPGYSKRIPCCISKIINDVVMLMESEIFRRNLEINLDITNDLPAISGDSDQLKQVFLNILKNALEALPNGGKIFLHTSQSKHEDYVKVVIKDTGVGMDEQTIASIFDPFFTTKEKGTGLGMFIIKKVIDNHGGHLDIQSKPGNDTTVTVLLPTS